LLYRLPEILFKLSDLHLAEGGMAIAGLELRFSLVHERLERVPHVRRADEELRQLAQLARINLSFGQPKDFGNDPVERRSLRILDPNRVPLKSPKHQLHVLPFLYR